MKRLESDLSTGISDLPSFPIVLVTVGDNIITVGAFHFYSFEPPSLMVGIMPDKYSHKLLLEVGDYGVNIPTTEQIPLVRTCGSVSGKDGVDKYEAAGVTPSPSSVIQSKLIKECPMNIECDVVHRITHPGSHEWFVGEVRAVHVEEEFDSSSSLMFWGKHFRSVGEALEKI